MKTWVNTYLGEPYEEKTKGVDYMKREDCKFELPEGVLVLSCGVTILKQLEKITMYLILTESSK